MSVNYYFGSLRLVKKEITIKKKIIYRARGVGCLLESDTDTDTDTQGCPGFWVLYEKKEKEEIGDQN